MPPGHGRPTDATSSRVSSDRGGGNRFDLAADAIPAPGIAAPVEKADWSVPVGGPVNGGGALYTADPTGARQSCGDRLYVPVNVSGAPSLWVFDNLYATDGSGAACTNGSPVGCSPSANGHCPVLQAALNVGQLKGSSIAVNGAGTRVYTAAQSGVFTTLSTGIGQPTSVLRQFDARTDTGASDATFVLSTPWVDFGTQYVYAAVGYKLDASGPTRARLYRFTADGALASNALGVDKIDLPAGVEASLLELGGIIYVPALDGRIYKVIDSGTSLTLAAAPWPVALSAGLPINSSPTIDFANNLLFVGQANSLWMIDLNAGTTRAIGIGGAVGNTACTSSPWVDAQYHLVYIGHNNAVQLVSYQPGPPSAWNGTVAVSAAVSPSASSDAPKSSPIVLNVGTTYELFIGDGGGALNKFYVNPGISGRTTFAPGNGAIDGPPIVDVQGGNIYFGGGSRFYQITQANLN